MRLPVWSIIGIAAHLAVGGVVVLSMARSLADRESEVDRLRIIANEEHAQTTRLAEQLDIEKNLLDGLRKKDPYVIEYLARMKHGFAGEKEVQPPTVDADNPIPSLNANQLTP